MSGIPDDPSILYPPESAMPVTEDAIAQVFDEIDVVYFMEEGFDAAAYEMAKLQDTDFDCQTIGKEMYKLKRQLQVVSKKVSALITKNKDEFSSMTEHYEMIRQEAGGMLELITKIRRNLARADAEVMNGLKIVANERKREMSSDLKTTLTSIKTLYDTLFRLQELVQEGDFPLAIRLSVEATNAAQEFTHFACIKELSSKFTNILSSMESHIDDALATLTVSFDQDKYSLVYSAYQMMDNVGGAASKLSSFFRATLESSARSVLIDRLRHRMALETTDSMSYEQLCEAVDMDEVIDSIRELGFVLCRYLFIYHDILKFHIDEDERRLCSMPIGSESDGGDSDEIVEKGIMQKSLSDGLYSIFKTASSKFNTLLCCHDLSQLKFDNFLDVVEMANRFRKFGRKYFGNSCGEVALSLETQTGRYFGRYHRERLEELKMFLETEMFTLCPVPSNFTLFDLQEFQFLKESTDAFDDDDSHLQYLIDHVGLGEQLDYDLLTSDVDNPFCAPKDENAGKKQNGSSTSTRTSASDSEDDTYAAVSTSKMPLLCNTALNVLRFFGKYIRMTSLLHSVAEEAITSIIQLFEYFVYSIYEFFCRDMVADHVDANIFTSLQLRKLIESIKSRLILEDENNEEFKQIPNGKMVASKLSPCLDLGSIDACYQLTERIIGIESLVFLKRQFEDLRPVLQSLVPHNKPLPFLEKFFQVTLPVIVDVRKSALGCVASRAAEYSKILKQIMSTNFNLSEIQDRHSGYVDSIVVDLKTFDEKLNKSTEFVQIPAELQTLLWSAIVFCVSRILVQGYSECNKKCTQEGRALMLLDLEHLTKHLETLSSMKPIPHRIYVEEYIKAFYLPDNCMDEWIGKHPEYSVSQISSLLNSSVTKRAKNKILNVLEGN